MIQYVFSIYDQKAGAYLKPFFAPSKGLVLRELADTVNSPDHAFAKHAADYTIFELGSWDDNDAKFSPHGAPMSLGSLVELKE